MKDFEQMYEVFFEKNRKYDICNDSTTKKIFKEIYEPKTIGKMIYVIEDNKPAVLGIVDIMEKHFGENKIDNHWKKSCGAWIAFILKDFGYIKTHIKKLGNVSKHFSSGSCYVKANERTKELIVKYEVRDL